MLEEKIIDITITKSTENIFEVLRKNGFEIKEKKNTFLRTEQLLYLLPKLKEAISKNKSKINDLKKYGIEKKGSAVHTILANNSISKDEDTIIQNEINKLNQRNYIIDSKIRWIYEVLKSVSNDKYYEIINLKYFQNKTMEDIAEYFDVSTEMIRKSKNKLINEIKVLLFPNDSIDDLGF